ncbi:MAG: bifunctional 4-hydroxy-2-oxoglutarate aldolase/2-dehydro-3-deoxy-phosphogluconate aldolase [Negativicutes bacterium]
MNVIKEQILYERLIIIARRVSHEKMADIAKALAAGGIAFLESTFDQSRPDCIEENQKCIREIIKTVGDTICVGAGTVLSADQVRAAHEAGAKYIISPNTDFKVIEETRRLNMVSIPGAMTPSEIMAAYNAGADIVKLFPADDLGFHYIKNILAPLSHVPLIATGGVNPQTIQEFFACGIRAVGTGITVLKPDLVAAGEYVEITKLARAHTEAVRACR